MPRRKVKLEEPEDYEEEYEDDEYEDDDDYEENDEDDEEDVHGPGRVLIVFASLLGVVLLVVIGVIGYGIYAQKHMQSVIAPYVGTDLILPNVSVDGISIGGMTRSQAEATLRNADTLEETQTITVHLPDRDLSFSTELKDFDQDIDAIVEEACSYGHESGTLDGLYAAVKNAEDNPKELSFYTASSYDEQEIRDTINAVASEIYVEPVQTTINKNYDGLTVDVVIGTPGTCLDSETLINAVLDEFASGTYDDITFEYATKPIETVTASDVLDGVLRDPVNAYYDRDTESVAASQLGYGTNVTESEIQAALDAAAPGESVTIPLYSIEPDMDTETMESMLFQDILYSYGSTYSSNANRTTNLRLACEQIDGYVVNPGETFSFNDVVGERTAAKGYQSATVYIDNGESDSQLGGGVCQVASTIYYCCLYAELEVVERQPHYYVVSYVPAGMDAAIYWGSVDFKFRNNTDYPIKINAYLSNGRCYIELIGTDTENHIVRMSTEKVTNTTESGGPAYRLYRKVYSSSYALLEDEDLGVSYYYPSN